MSDADLARTQRIVEAAEALAAHESKHWAIDGDDAAEQARLVLAVGAAVRKGGER